MRGIVALEVRGYCSNDTGGRVAATVKV